MHLAQTKYIMRIKGTFGCTALLLIAALFPLAGGAGLAFGQVFRGYYPGGRQVQVQSDWQGRKNIIKTYYPGGKIEVIYEYENGKLNGTVRQYFENGVLKAEITYHQDKRTGPAKYYYPSGLLMARIEYDNDKETGNSRFYDEAGRPMNVLKR
jgi:antitoxin component YwqK of YwqJK toxin-antitoxin module